MTEPTKALPCPFCESQPTAHNDTDGPFWVVACGNLECAAQPETSGETEADAIAAWNRRTPPAVAGEPFAWESITTAYTKYVTQSRYEKFSPTVRSWYKPFKCSSCTTPQPTQAQAGAVPLTDAQLLLQRFATSSLFLLFERWNNKEIPHYQLMEEMGQVVKHVIRRTVADHGIGIKGGQHGADT